METLPLDVFRNHIWKNLSLFDIFRRARFTCKLWYQNIIQSIDSVDLIDEAAIPGPATMMCADAWQKSKFLAALDPKNITSTFTVSTMAYGQARRYTEQLFSHFKFITTLNIRISHPNGEWTPDHAVVQLPFLTDLRVQCNMWPFSDESTEILAPKITSITMRYDSTDLIQRFASKMPRLRSLHVTSTSSYQISSVLRSFPDLRSLVFFPEEGEDTSYFPPRLESLETSCDATGGEIFNFSSCAETLKHLLIASVNRIPSDRVPEKLQLDSLETLVCYDGFFRDFAPALAKLRHLSFKFGYDTLTPEQAKYMSSVRSLSVHRFPADCQLTLSHFPHLENLVAFSDQTSAAPVPPQLYPTLQAAPHLRTLELSMYATSSSLIEGLRGLVHLERIHLLCLEDEPISDAAWDALCSLSSLTYLDIAADPKKKSLSRSESDVVKLCSSLPSLQHLSLSEIVAIENSDAAQRLIRALKKGNPILDYCFIATQPKDYVEPDW